MVAMDKLSQLKIFQELYSEIDGYEVSRTARVKLPFITSDVYGEIDFDNFYDILSQAKPQPGEVFYDLGSGSGKAVVLAALAFPFSRCVGVEKFKDLYDTSIKVAEKLRDPRISFVQSDLTTHDFTDADVIYLNSYYFQEIMAQPEFMHKIESLKKGTRVIFVSTKSNSPSLTVLHAEYYEFSWGYSKVYITEKR